MKLKELLAGVGAESFPSSLEVAGVSDDSRQVREGELFVAVPGTQADGAQFAIEAVKRGAAAVVAEKPLSISVPLVQVPSARKALALIAANLSRRPAEELKLLGITGTNGKTTTAFLLESICASGGACTGLLGTIEYRFAGKVREPSHTTPGPLELHRLLREMVDAGVDTVVMEVSSHALSQERVHGLTFSAAALLNLSRDHLDYHKDLEAYFQAKRRLFVEHLSPGGVAVVNGEDTYAGRVYNELRNQRRIAWKFSRQGNAELSVAGAELSTSGIKATLKTPAGDIPIKSTLVGTHNLENILAAAGMALSAGYSRRDVQEGIERVRRVPGRMERVEAKGQLALVDYAHTDEALRRSLESVRALGKGRVVVVFGCGGDRDKGKRPLMGEAAGELADLPVVTSDNPRSEGPEEIISQILPGLEKAGLRRISVGKAKAGEKGYLVEPDRAAAIRLAASMMKPGDLLLIAGKGHETYQQVDGEKHPFDDREEAKKAFEATVD